MLVVVLFFTAGTEFCGWRRIASGPPESLRGIGERLGRLLGEHPNEIDPPEGSEFAEIQIMTEYSFDVIKSQGFEAWLNLPGQTDIVGEIRL